MKNKILIVGILIVLAYFGFASAQPYGSCPMGSGGFFGGMMYGSYGSGAMIFSWIFCLLVIVALVLFIVWIVKQLQKK